MDSVSDEQDARSAKSLWGDTRFSDATIVLGGHTWNVHRWVVCRQCEYFMQAIDGDCKQESQSKTAVLMCQDFVAEDIDSMFRFLYTGILQRNQEINPLRAFDVAESLGVSSLRSAALNALKRQIEHFVDNSWWRNYRKVVMQFLAKYSNTDVENVLIQVTAAKAHAIIYQPLVTWDDIIGSYPLFANRVLKKVFPQLQQPALFRAPTVDEVRSNSSYQPRGSSRFAPY